MSENRRATRYGAFFESAEKTAAPAPTKRKSPSRNEATVKKEVAPRKSPARKSPARVEIVKKEVKKEKASKSPARVRTASKSRKASKSPARVPKKEKKDEKVTKKASTSKKTKSDPSILIEKINPKQLSPKAKKPVVDVESDVDSSPRPRRRTRQGTAAERQSLSASASQSVADAIHEYSDHDDPEISFKRRGASKLDEIKEFGGPIGAALLILSYLIAPYFLQYFCTSSSCIIRQPTWTAFKLLATYFNKDLLLIVGPFILSVAILNIFPLGRVVQLHNERGYTEYHFNGCALSILTVAGIIGAEYLKYPIVNILYANTPKLLLIFLVSALLQAIYVFIRSRGIDQAYWNPSAKTGSGIQDFYIGREVNPKYASLIDIKLVNYQLSLLVTLVLSGIVCYKSFQLAPISAGSAPVEWYEKIWLSVQNGQYNYASLIASSLIILYVLDLLLHEHHLSKSFELQLEGVGAGLLLRYAVAPFNLTLIARYALDSKVRLPWYTLTLIGLVFCICLWTKRRACRVKHEFRIDSTSKTSLAFHTIPTFQGRRLLADSLWKFVRQPNYTAEIFLHACLLLTLTGKFALPPLFAILFTISILIIRSVQLDARNANRYESAWQRYCQEVPYVLVPKVY